MGPKIFTTLIFLIGIQSLPADVQEVDLLAGGGLGGFEEGKTTGWELSGEVSAVPGKQEFVYEKAGDEKGVVLVNGRKKNRASYLFSKEQFGDVRVQMEFMVPKGSNSGVYLMGRYEIQIFDSFGVEQVKHGDLGGVYQRWDSKRKPGPGYEGVAPKVNAAAAPGEWQTLEITFRAPRFDASGKKTEPARFLKVLVNGQLVQKNQEVSGPTRAAQFKDEKASGPIVIQGDHGPIAIRKYVVKSLD